MDPEMQRMLEEARRNVLELAPPEAKSRIDAGEVRIVIDVREPVEWAQGRLPGAVHVPMRELPSSATEPGHPLNEARSQPVLVYCSHGVRSLMAADALKKMGYSQVESIAGGLVEWARAGYPLEFSDWTTPAS